MKKLFFSVTGILLLFVASTSAQALTDSETVTLFEIDSPVTTDATNFDNLFRNFSKYIENGNTIEFLSYQKVGTIKNRGQIKKYLKHDLSPATGFYLETLSRAENRNEENRYSEIKILPAPSDRTDIKYGWEKRMDTVGEFIRPGMDVYEIEFIHAKQSQRYYVFVDPTDHRVVTEGNAFALKIPLTHVAYINAQKD